ncbi:MAG: GNAT family N-acetyltransferase [Caldilineaceae bacterium]
MPTVIVALHEHRSISPEAVRALYDLVGWWPQRSLDDIALVLEHGPAVGAWLGEELVGFARAVTDGKLRAYIEDVMVHPGYRRQGIGEQLMETLLTVLAHIETVSLFCEPGLVAWYEQHNFKLRSSQRVLHRIQPNV